MASSASLPEGALIHLSSRQWVSSSALGRLWLSLLGGSPWEGPSCWRGGIFDLLDGAVARVAGKVSDFGAFYDACLDRCSDGAPLVGLLALYAQRGAIAFVVLVGLALLGTLLVPYVRARAEGLIGRCNVGIMECPERVILLGVGGVFRVMPVVLWIVTPLIYLTVAQRIHYTWRTLRAIPSEVQEVDETGIFDLRRWRTRQ